MKKQDVINFFGSHQKVADFIGKSRSTVTMWHDPIRPEWAMYLDQATQGQLKFDPKHYSYEWLTDHLYPEGR